ncbi:putative protein EIN4-like [Capsicum annuum]|nr:putative protein EIN4-like [Capsicum annuum]
MELFGATTITRKIILEGGANDAPLTVFETTSHYDYDHNGGCPATAEKHNMTVDNPSTASKDEEKVDPLINNYSEWISNGLLKHHAGRYCQQQPEVFQNEECLINIIKGFSIPVGLPWHLVDKVYILINCSDEFHWVLAVIVLKEGHIRVYDSMSRRRCSGLSSEIQKLVKILPTYLDMSGFLDQKVRTDWSTIEAYRDKMANPFDI